MERAHLRVVQVVVRPVKGPRRGSCRSPCRARRRAALARVVQVSFRRPRGRRASGSRERPRQRSHPNHRSNRAAVRSSAAEKIEPMPAPCRSPLRAIEAPVDKRVNAVVSLRTTVLASSRCGDSDADRRCPAPDDDDPDELDELFKEPAGEIPDGEADGTVLVASGTDLTGPVAGSSTWSAGRERCSTAGRASC